MRALRALRGRWGCRLALLALVLVLAVPFVFARAGGGGGYSGGGGGGYSGGGGGGGGGEAYLIYFLVRLAVRYPLIGFPLLAGALYVMYAGGTKGRSAYVGRQIVRGNAAQLTSRMRSHLNRLKTRDPDFTPEKFLPRLRQAFLKIQDAWSRQDMSPARGFISDGVSERFSLQIEMQKAMGIRNDMKDVRVLDAHVVQVQSDPHFDTIHASVRASAVDTDVSLEDGRVLRNHARRPEEFVEVWSFLRRPGVKTLGKPGPIEGFCPNCGAPLEITDAARCASCQSWVNSGEYDWVLAEITQSCEWQARDPGRAIPGFGALAAADPALNVQFLEDRASVAFWRWQIAHWEADARSLTSVAADGLRGSMAKTPPEGRTVYKDAAVGGVEVLACEKAEPRDKVHVQIRWSGEKFIFKDGAARSQGEVWRHHVLVLERKSDAKTDARSGLRSSRCGNCGAPPSDRKSARCEYCQTPFNDGSRHWILTQVVPRGLWSMPAAAPAEKAPAGEWSGPMAPTAALAVLVGTMVADGNIDPREMAFAQAHAKKHNIPPARVDRLIQAARAGKLEIPRPKTPAESEAFLMNVVRMALADGRVSGGEMKTLLAFGRQLRMTPAAVKGMVESERKAMYAKAKQALAEKPAREAAQA